MASSAEIADVADAVVTRLNAAPGGTFNEAFTAARKVLPVLRLEEMGSTLSVTIAARGKATERATRTTRSRDYRIDVAVQKRVTPDGDGEIPNADVDALCQIVQEIDDYLDFVRVHNSNAIWIESENDPAYLPEHLLSMHVFTSVLTVTFRIHR